MIFCIEDEESIRDLMIYTLNGAGFDAKGFSDGKGFFEALQQERPRLILLDIMLPGEDGISILKRLRSKEETAGIPVMMATAKGTEYDKVMGLDLGADDYLTKPFNPMEAMARINSNIRRFYSLGAKSKELKQLQVRNLRLDTESCVVYQDDQPIDLTSVEYKLLRLFMEHPGKVFTKQQVYENVWGEEYAIADNNIMVCISRLRAKLSEDSSAYIKTIRGLGYRMEKE